MDNVREDWKQGGEKQSKLGRGVLSDAAVVVFVVTITAYASMYFYQFGFCDTLHIPWQFISLEGRDFVVGVANFIGTAASVGHPVALLTGVPLVALMRWGLPKSAKLPRGLIPWIIPSGTWIPLFLLLFSFLPFRVVDPLYLWTAFSVAFFVILAGSLTLALAGRDTRPVQAFEIVAWLLFFVIVCHCIGSYRALHSDAYLFLDRKPNTIVLRVYGDKLVTTRFDIKTGCLETRFKELSSLGEKVHWEHVEALHPQSDCPP